MALNSTHVPSDAGVTVLITGMPEYKSASVLTIFITCNKLTGFLSVMRLPEVYNVTRVHEYLYNSNPGNRSSELCNRGIGTFRS